MLGLALMAMLHSNWLFQDTWGSCWGRTISQAQSRMAVRLGGMSPAMMELMVPLPSHPSTFTATTLASLATPTIRPAATEATCVPCPSQSEAFQSLLPSEKSHLRQFWCGKCSMKARDTAVRPLTRCKCIGVLLVWPQLPYRLHICFSMFSRDGSTLKLRWSAEEGVLAR